MALTLGSLIFALAGCAARRGTGFPSSSPWTSLLIVSGPPRQHADAYDAVVEAVGRLLRTKEEYVCAGRAGIR